MITREIKAIREKSGEKKLFKPYQNGRVLSKWKSGFYPSLYSSSFLYKVVNPIFMSRAASVLFPFV